MPSLPLGSTQGRTTSGVACHHRLWAAHTVERRRAWQVIIASGHHKRSNDVRRGMPSLPLGSTDGQTASGVACHHRLWPEHTIKRRRAWHAIIAFGLYTWSNDVWCGMTSPPVDGTRGRTTSSVACHHRHWAAYTIERRRAWHDINAFGQHTRSNDIGCGMPSSPLGSIDGRTTSDVACHHSPWTTHTIKQHWVCYDITAFGQHTLPNDVRRGML